MQQSRSFEQSRSIRHAIANEWRDSLFDLLDRRPRDTVYSIAFQIAITPLYEGIDAYSCGSEMFHLTDELIRDTDTLSVEELLASRIFDHATWSACSNSYSKKMNSLRSIHDRWIQASKASSSPELRLPLRESSSPKAASPPESPSSAFLTSDAEWTEMTRVFKDIDDATLLPLPMTVNGRKLHARLMNVLSSSRETTIPLRNEPFDKLFTTAETFLRYAPVVYRYESLEPLRRAVMKKRGVQIFPIFLPRLAVWQAGSSQLLWIILHTLAALSVARGNLYINRLMVLLCNVAFFIGCGECHYHWLHNGGTDYFDALANYVKRRVTERGRCRIPIDVVLAKRHNDVALGSHLNRSLNAWIVGQIILDYRQFVTTRLLTTETNTTTTRYERYLSWLNVLLTITNEDSEDRKELLLEALGQRLLSRLWQDVDSIVPVGLF